MDRAILAMPGREHIPHEGFTPYINDSPYDNPWHRCCHGHYNILRQYAYKPIVILEDDVMLCPDFHWRLWLAEMTEPEPKPFIVHLYAGVRYEAFPVEQRPFELPPETQDWGTQAIYYSAAARGIAADLCSAYLRTPINRKGAPGGVRNGFDCFLFPALRSLAVKVFYFAAVQHMVMPSTCLSPVHWSSYFPAPSEFPLAGWW